MSDEITTNQETSENTSLSLNSEVNMGFDPSTIPPEPLESPRNADIPVSLNNTNAENTPVLTENPEESKPTENDSVEAENQKTEPISEPAQTSETGTAQMAGNEPLGEAAKAETPEPQTQKAEATPPPAMQTSRNRVLELLGKGKLATQFT